MTPKEFVYNLCRELTLRDQYWEIKDGLIKFNNGLSVLEKYKDFLEDKELVKLRTVHKQCQESKNQSPWWDSVNALIEKYEKKAGVKYSYSERCLVDL